MANIDIHNHILPALDDGPAIMEGALDLAREFIRQGTDRVIATPHGFSPLYHAEAIDIMTAVETFRQKLHEANIPLQIKPGMEIHYHPRTVFRLLKKEALFLGESGTTRRFALIELPTRTWPQDVTEMVYELSLRDVQVIIAHPERYLPAQQDEHVMDAVLAEGAWMQLTAGSITGQFGSTCERLSRRWLASGKALLIASDAHDASMRSPKLQEALQIISQDWNLPDVVSSCIARSQEIWDATEYE